MKSTSANYAIRVDATSQTGTGHFMRCLALANMLVRHGARVQFFTQRIPRELHDLATASGHSVVHLKPGVAAKNEDGVPHASWLETSQRFDAELVARAIGGTHMDAVIVDHYALDARWESMLREHARKIMVIDDLADRHHDCDLLLDQNLFDDMQARYSSIVPEHCRLLLGPTYALLRDEFREARSLARLRDGTVRRVLVLMGGVDLQNLTAKAVEAISDSGQNFDVDVVVTRLHPAFDRIATMCNAHGYALHVQPPNIAILMGIADLGIGACGSTAWERCCLGLPTICVAEVPHQQAMAEGLESQGAIVNLGKAEQIGTQDFVRAIAELVAQPGRVARLSAAAGRLVDGMGAERVCLELAEAT